MRKGLKQIAVDGFYERIIREVEQKGSTLVRLRGGGKVTQDDLHEFAARNGWAVDFTEQGVRIGRQVQTAA